MLPAPEGLAESLDECEKQGIRGTFFSHESYPVLLGEIPDPPAVLFYSGDIQCISGGKTVAVIGSRRCSLYGRKAARSIAAALCSAGVCVVSGLARGIDGEAHRGALAAGGPTAAVFAGGLDVVYPPEHRKLAGSIRDSGCLVSEYPPGARPARYTFPERNRIISGLCPAVVVVEAGERSGTMITVGTALDQGRDVFAVPGEMGRTTSAGTNRLLRDGAGIVLSPGDLLDALGLTAAADRPETDDPLLRALGSSGKTPEQLQQATGAEPSELRAKLLQLELIGAVVRRPGNIFVPV